MLKMSLQDSRAWTYYCIKMGIQGALSWEQVSPTDKTWARVNVNREMIHAGAPHRHP